MLIASLTVYHLTEYSLTYHIQDSHFHSAEAAIFKEHEFSSRFDLRSDEPEAIINGVCSAHLKAYCLACLHSIYGDFYYSTGLNRPISSSVNAAAVEELLANLKNKGYYTIARVPALRDRAYGLENVADGLPITGGYLWMDDQGCYWLNPNREGTISYLMDIASELRDMGFNEVVFDEFRFPETDQIIFEEDKQQALADTAKLLVTSCATDYFAVSFISDGTWTMPEGKSRMYRTDISTPAEMMELMETLTLDNAAVRLVFITNNMDARFEAYGVLRPANLAH
jgi:hypothetical protein